MLLENATFISKLIEKLSRGSKKSIQLNATPGASITRLDISDIDKLSDLFSANFIKKLTNEPDFNIEITLSDKKINSNNESNKTVKRLNNLSKQNVDYFLEHGVETFGFGYPILIKRDSNDPKSIIKAPVFIWSLKIEESRSKSNTWKIKRQEDFQIRINEVLISFLETNENVKIDKIHEDFLDDSLLDFAEITTLLENITASLNNKKTFNPSNNFIPFKDLEDIEKAIQDEIQIVNSGIFGLFLMQKESIINDLKRIKDGDFKEINPIQLNFIKKNLFSIVETDPSQQQIINELPFTDKFIIHGPPGTGKSQTLTAVISNFASNGLKCLVVCEKRTALEVIYENLRKEDLEEIVALIEDPSKDRRKIIDKARNTIDEVHSIDQNNSFEHYYFRNEHDILLDSILLKSELFDNFFEKSDSFVLDGKKWKDLVSVYISNNSPIDLMEGKNSFSFDEKEFLVLSKLVKESSPLFSHFKPLESHLNKINFSNFSKKDFLDKRNFLEKELRELRIKINNIKIDLNTLSFDTFGSFKYRFLALFSSNAKENINFHKKYLDLIHEINSLNQLNLKEKNGTKKDDILNHLKILTSIIDGIILEKDKIPYFEKWLEISSNLENKYVEIVTKLSRSGTDIEILLKKWFFGNLLNKNDFKFVESPIELLGEELEKNKDYIRSKALNYWEQRRYKSIQHFNEKSESLNAKQLFSKSSSKGVKKKTLRQIVKTDFKLFTDIFPVVLINPSVCSSIFDLSSNLFNVVIFDEASQLRIEDTFAAMLRGQIKIISGDEKQMPPSSYFSSTEISFNDEIEDDEIFNEDSLGQEYAMKESLLEFASESHFRDIYLNMHYRSKHPQLIDFSNAAFYKNKLIPMPQLEDYKPIEYINVVGTYSDRTNIKEALKIVSILENEIELQNSEYPSIGVATFNINQRNLILDLINKRCIENPEFRKKIVELEKKELFIKNVENIQGDEREVIIISTTFGKNDDGAFYKRFGPVVNKTKGHKLLNVLITRAKIRQIVVTSFPEEAFFNYKSILQSNGICGLGILYSYLAYAKAVSEKNNLEINEILTNLSIASDSDLDNNRLFQLSNSIAELIKEKLIIGGISTENIKTNYTFGGFNFDILIQHGDSKLAIDVDSSNFRSIKSSYHSYIFKKKQLLNYGIKYHILWSVKFWENENFEISKILGLLL